MGNCDSKLTIFEPLITASLNNELTKMKKQIDFVHPESDKCLIPRDLLKNEEQTTSAETNLKEMKPPLMT